MEYLVPVVCVHIRGVSPIQGAGLTVQGWDETVQGWDETEVEPMQAISCEIHLQM